MKKLKIFFYFKRFLASNKYFWKYRHLFQKNIFKHTYGQLPKIHFDNIFKNKNIISVLDFGCATGDKLNYFVKRGSKNVYGIDINTQAVNTAKDKFKNYNINYKFSKKIKSDEINIFFKIIQKKKFDLVILDRVLYILEDDEFFEVIRKISSITKFIYIDDFFLSNKFYNENKLRLPIQGYKHSNFDKVLSANNFTLKIKKKSPYKEVILSNTGCALYENLNT